MFPQLLQSVNTPVRELALSRPVCIHEVETVCEALARIRNECGGCRIVHFYVIDPEGRLVGVAPVRRLLLADPSTLVGEIMVHPVHSVAEDNRFGSALELLAAHRLLALPVVDRDGRLAAVLDVSDTTRALAALERQDSERKLFQTLGVRSGRRRRTLISSLLVGMVLAAIMAAFQHVVLDFPSVMLFVPLVLAVAAGSAICAVTDTVERLKWTGERGGRPGGRHRPSLTGIAGALIAGAAAGIGQHPVQVAFATASSLVIALVAGAELGRLIPQLLHRWRLEPKVAAGPIVTAIASAVALSCYLALCTVLPHSN